MRLCHKMDFQVQIMIVYTIYSIPKSGWKLFLSVTLKSWWYTAVYGDLSLSR